MNFLILSDLHLEFEPIEISVSVDVDAVILAGDIAQGVNGVRWAKQTFENTPVIYVAGNHEYYGNEVNELTEAIRAETVDSNVVWLEKNSIVLGSTRILGTTLWTDFALFAEDDEEELAWSMADCRRYVPDFDGRIRWSSEGRSVELTPEVTRSLHLQSVAWLKQELSTPFSGKTLVVTHHAPSINSVAGHFSKHPATPAWASQLDDLVMKADIWCHGHTHEAYNYWLGKCNVRCNPRGYGQESEFFDPNCLLSI